MDNYDKMKKVFFGAIFGTCSAGCLVNIVMLIIRSIDFAIIPVIEHAIVAICLAAGAMFSYEELDS